ncbi:MAG: polysaccharide pyruvyl transferase family protein [Bacteroidaceae bacterium]|nr:polysaccharide pyruvyl transferase family protein [Bacteroidaceae bacterium]
MTRKKIGCVISYTKNHNNYGTSLQAYAMLKKIQQLGYDIEVIHYIKQLSLMQKANFVWNAYRCGELKKIFRNKAIEQCKKEHPNYAKGLQIRTIAVNKYKEKKLLPFFHDYKGYKALHEGSKNYSSVIVGSDQVWTPLSLPNKFFNLLFVDDNVRKVAYASSFGVSDIPHFQKKATREFLNRFDVIGVREQRGKELVDTLSHNIATVVADPTLLLTSTEWEKEIEDARPIETDSYIFCYFLSENVEARKQTLALSKKTGLKIITIRHMEQYRSIDETIGDIAPYDVDPNDFVKYISKATYVCTDSFHCTVFSTLFHRQFMTFYRTAQMTKNSRNSRIDSLFSVLGINKEHIYAGDINKIDTLIDWKLVDKNLKKLREDSIMYLDKALR